jgi:hypothetical protein
MVGKACLTCQPSSRTGESPQRRRHSKPGPRLDPTRLPLADLMHTVSNLTPCAVRLSALMILARTAARLPNERPGCYSPLMLVQRDAPEHLRAGG